MPMTSRQHKPYLLTVDTANVLKKRKPSTWLGFVKMGDGK